MREVDTSETSVVWPAWCYSGETTVNEDLPQRLVAAAAAAASAVSPSPIVLLGQQEDHQRQNARNQQEHRQASSNQSRSSSASSASVSSSPASSPHSRTSPLSRLERRRVKRKSITRTSLFNQSPVAGLASSAIAAALEAGSVAAVPGSSPGGLLGLSANRRVAEVLYNGRSLEGSNGAVLLSNNQHDRSSDDAQNEAASDEEIDSVIQTKKKQSVQNNRFSVINTKLLQEYQQQRQTKLQTLDKMLSERIYDRKKYLNSPTGSSGGASAVGSSTSASAFYEKYRNGASGDSGESQLNLIKNGTAGGVGGGSIGSLNGVSSSAHLSAIAASIISSSNGSNKGSNVSNNSEENGTLSLHGGNNSSSNQISTNKNGNSGNNNNNNSNTNNNNISSGAIGLANNSNSSSIKSERFSPPNNDAQSMASRSRSVTPSSFSGTPPQTMHTSDAGFSSSISTGGLLPSPNSSSGAGNSIERTEFQTRNYSDFMRSLAAKYNNNNNTNDVSSMKNSFLEPKMRLIQPKSYMERSLNSKKGSPLTSTQVPNPSIMTSLFSGLPFQSAVFPPLIDMSSTQALVTLARAAKDSEVHNILKADTGGGLKKLSSLSRGNSPPPTATLGSHHFPSPFGTGYLPRLLPNHHHLASFPSQSPTLAAASGPLKSPSRAPESTALVSTFPLDLSASTPSGSKRIKLSPTPSRHQETSPAPSSTNSQPSADSLDLKPIRKCHARVEEISAWTVDNVCDFVASIDICAEYVQNFRDQSIDGSGLPLLTEEHLTNSLGMKLGPALKLRSMLAKKLGGPCPCALCSVPAPTPPARTNSSGSSSSKGDTTPTNRPPSNEGSIG
ncbi:probable serine/threonine-protein kinase DDB_G0282963 [Anopheles maculipalpis]|uniref:probable serine/threonine-protein kinase DDB_G0282963 n=1 Tax=Anopheles maculipalpis TaxID=1496333 RepID=UPI0021594A3D|nr:probable serine/threonine-protein kinase DDB_G0282963 [Anopheles maculipalpis]